MFSLEELLASTGGEAVNSPAPAGVSSISTDSRKDSPGSLFVALSGESFDGHGFLSAALAKGASILCVERAKLSLLPAGAPALVVDSCLEAYQRLAAFHRDRFKDLKLVALTGSSGKTSAKEMLKAIFERAYGKEHVLATEGNLNNQVGVPITLFRLESHHKLCVVEMGTNHFGEIEPLSRMARPDIALIVSIGRCHLEHFGSTEGVAKEKSSIFKHLRPAGVAVIPASGNNRETLLETVSGGKVLGFGDSEGSDVWSEYLGGRLNGSEFILRVKDGRQAKVSWSLSGAHQARNAAGAAAVALSLGVELPVIAEGLANCALPGMRARIATHGGATWINDAYNANPDSMKASIEWLSGFADNAKLLVGLGDMRELGESALPSHMETLEYAIARLPGAKLVAIGPFMCEAVAKLSLPIVHYPDSVGAASHFQSLARPGDTVFIKASRGTKLELLEPSTP